MGIGVSVHGTMTDGRSSTKDSAFQAIQVTLPGLVIDPLLSRIIDFDQQGEVLQCLIHPLSDPLEFAWPGDGRLIAMTKTTTLGPGYHAFIVDVLKALGAKLNIRWDWSEDESPYSRTGDFEHLQQEMVDHLAGLAQMLLKPGAFSGCMAVNLPMGITSSHNVDAITPLGPRDRDWWEMAANPAHTRRISPEFYGWWNKDHDAAARLNLGLGLMWSIIRWHPPESEAEAQLITLALDAADSAITEDPSLNVPASEMNELSELLEADPEESMPPPPSPDGIGYYRHPQHVLGPGGWSIEVPGYFYVQPQEDGNGSVLHYSDRTIHLSAYGLDTRHRPSTDAILDDLTAECRKKISLHHAVGQLAGRAYIERGKDDDWEGFVLQGWMVGPETFAYVTVTFTQESGRQWAINTWRSLTGGRAPNDD